MGLNLQYLNYSVKLARCYSKASRVCPGDGYRRCKVLVVGGGAGGCSVAARLARAVRSGDVVVLEPSRLHYYQPMFALIAAGIRPSNLSHRPMRSVLPRSVCWLRDHAQEFEPCLNLVRTKGGKTIEYEYMVVALGVKNDYDKYLNHSVKLARCYSKASRVCPGDGYRRCKVLVVGGGAGGCSVAARLARAVRSGDVVVLEPSRLHYYQPMFALIAAGIRPSNLSHRPMRSVLPRSVCWLRDHAQEFEPCLNLVRTKGGKTIEYEYMVVALGVKNDYDKIPGLQCALNYPYSGVCTIYSDAYCVKTWCCLKNFQGGHAIFTFPKTIGKCPGAAQKIMYLADDYWRQQSKMRSVANITYNTGGQVLFGIDKYAKELHRVIKSRCIAVNYCTDLVALDDGKAIFEDAKGTKTTLPYNFLHVTPPMSPPSCLKKCSQLANEAGFLTVDPHTLQHTSFPNVFGIGDCMDTPNSKTAAAVAVQSAVVERNLLRCMDGEAPKYNYNGYSACPMMTSYSSGIISEFLYNKTICETFPFDQSKEGRLVVYLNKFVFPYLYWNRLLKGKYSGPATLRRIINPVGK